MKTGRAPALARALALVLLASAGPAAADVFDRLSGTFGRPLMADDCRHNPHVFRFSTDRTRAFVDWNLPIRTYRGLWETSAEYEIVGHDETGVTMRFADETRLTADGRPVVWIMRPVAMPEGYCWGRTDWPAERCDFHAVRCGEVPVS